MKNISYFLSTLFLLSASLAPVFSALAVEEPPKVYEDKGACPFECCTYRAWNVEKDTKLYDSPKGTTMVGLATKGQKVQGLTGIVYTVPVPMKVVYSHPPYQKGDTVFLLTYLGEGIQKVWFQGKIKEEEVLFLYNYGADKTCRNPSSECWGSFQGADPQATSTWWVRVKLPSGKMGWTKEADHFGGMDSCG